MSTLVSVGYFKKSLTILLLYNLLCLHFTISAQSISTVNFVGLNGSKINLGSYCGKKIIIIAFDAGNPDKKQLKSFDTLYRKSNKNIVVIGIPVNDFGSPMPTIALLSLLKDSLNISYPIAAISKGKKGVGQHPLMRWLTTLSKTNHFNNIDLEKAGEVFLISTHGVLYGVLPMGLPLSSSFAHTVLNSNPR